MRILVLLAKNPNESLLVRLHTEILIKEVKDLINRRMHSEAISAALTKGRLKKRIARHEMANIDVDAILSDDKVIWNLKR